MKFQFLNPALKSKFRLASKVALIIAYAYLCLFGFLVSQVWISRSVYDAPGIASAYEDIDVFSNPSRQCKTLDTAINRLTLKKCVLRELNHSKTFFPIISSLSIVSHESSKILTKDVDIQPAVEAAAIRGHEIINRNAVAVSAAKKANFLIEAINPLFTWIDPYLYDLTPDEVLNRFESAYYLPNAVRERQGMTNFILFQAKHQRFNPGNY
jgi:hypothetical protein